MQPGEMTATAEPRPVEVAHFVAALAARTAADEGVPAAPLFDRAADEDEPMSEDRGTVNWQEAGPDDGWSPPTRTVNAAWREHRGAVAAPAVATAQAVSPKKRVELGTHLARKNAMQPVADMLALVRERAGGQAVTDLKIVPPEPNPLRLTLHLAMNGDEFVVKVRTALGADRREEVQQALHVLETTLAVRLRMPARVVLLA
jgi:hypothetical protein